MIGQEPAADARGHLAAVAQFDAGTGRSRAILAQEDVLHQRPPQGDDRRRAAVGWVNARASISTVERGASAWMRRRSNSLSELEAAGGAGLIGSSNRYVPTT